MLSELEGLTYVSPFLLAFSHLCHKEDEIPSLARPLVDHKETRTFRMTELKYFTDQ